MKNQSLTFSCINGIECVSKIVKKNELDFYILAEQFNLAPTVIDIKRCEENKYGEYILTMEKYSHNLKEYIKINPSKTINLLEKSQKLYKNLHKIDICHQDTHLKNIVYDEKTERLRLIDFEQSVIISKDKECIVNEDFYFVNMALKNVTEESIRFNVILNNQKLFNIYDLEKLNQFSYIVYEKRNTYARVYSIIMKCIDIDIEIIIRKNSEYYSYCIRKVIYDRNDFLSQSGNFDNTLPEFQVNFQIKETNYILKIVIL